MTKNYITASEIKWAEDFQPLFDKNVSTYAKGETSIEWLYTNRKSAPPKLFTGVRTFQREKVASIPWKQDVMRTILEGGYKSIPEIHIRVKNPECYELTDGQQRTSAPLDFMDNIFPLPNMVVPLEDRDSVTVTGKYFKDLDEDIQQLIKDYTISCKWYVNLDDYETSDLFIKILNNTNTMNPQEIRNAVLGVYSNFVRDTARAGGDLPVHPLFNRTTVVGSDKEELIFFSPKFKLNGRMEVDEWLQNLCYMLHEKHDWKQGCSSQVTQTSWVTTTQQTGGKFSSIQDKETGKLVGDYTESKTILEVLDLAKSILENAPNRMRLTPMVSLMMVCYAVSLITFKGKGPNRRLNKTKNSFNPVIFAKKFEEVYKAWSDNTARLYEGHNMFESNRPMEPFSKLFGGKNPTAIGTIHYVLNQYTPEQWGVTSKDKDVSFTKDMKAERLAEQGGNCFWLGTPLLNDDNIAGDHYIPRSKKGKTIKSNLVVTSSRLNTIRSNMNAKDFSEYLRDVHGVEIDHAEYLKTLNGETV